MSDLEKGFFFYFFVANIELQFVLSPDTQDFFIYVSTPHIPPLPPSGAYRCCGERKKRRKHASFSPSLISAKKDSTFSPFVQKSGREKKTGKGVRQWCPPVVYLGGGGKREGWPFLGRRSAISGQEKKKFSLSLLSRQRLKGVSLLCRPPTNTAGGARAERVKTSMLFWRRRPK